LSRLNGAFNVETVLQAVMQRLLTYKFQ